MYRIGEFSKLCQLSVKTLRYYAKIGLLVPEYQDSFTGYRYYSATQLTEVVRIQALKEQGFTLAQIREAKSNPLLEIEKREQDMPMFHVRMKKQKPVSAHCLRQIFPTREFAWETVNRYSKNHSFVIVINYENEFCSENLDLELCIPEQKGEKILFQGTN